MKNFTCAQCQQLLFFENVTCTRCGHALAYLPDRASISPLVPADATAQGSDALFIAVTPKPLSHRYR
jgi:hypothetical protein